MARIRREDIDRLRRQADMAAVVGDHTRLTRSGRRLKGLCPFHDENTASFTIDPAENLFYCFGCNVGGDLFDFVMRIEGLEFVEAVEYVARRTGMTLRYEELSPGEKEARGRRTRIVELNRLALGFYRERLSSAEGAPAREYLRGRGLDGEVADEFQLGFAPNDWDRLTRHLMDEGHDRRLLLRAGLAKEGSGGRIRDRFRGRVVFPILDVSGDPIAFAGRIVPGLDYGDFDPPKYYNSPETPVYRKSRVLYGLHRARADIVRADEVLICEGYTDVMALHRAGFPQAVATCGTAVGAEHLRVLSRYAERIVLAFDADEAGAGAAERAWDQAGEIAGDEEPSDLRVLALPEGMDPADMVEQEGVGAVRTAVEDAPAVLPYLLRRVVAGGGEDERDRTRRLREALELLDTEPDPELRRAYAETEIARPLRLSLAHVEKTAARCGVALDAQEGTDPGSILRSSGVSRGGIAIPRGARVRLERDLLRMTLQTPHLLPDEWSELSTGAFSSDMAKAVFDAIEEAGGPGVDVAAVLDAAPDGDLRQRIRALALEDPPGEPSRDAAVELVRRLLARHLRHRVAELKEEADKVRHDTDPERWRELNAELRELGRRRERLRARRD